MTTKKKTGSYCRTRGHSWEREVARILRDYFPKAKRGLQYQDGRYAADVEGTPFRIECSRGKDSIKRKWDQVCRDSELAGDSRPNLVIKKWDRIGPVVTMSLEYFLSNFDKAEGEPNEGSE